MARSSGRTRIIAAPVVPTMLAMAVPNARIAVLTSGVPRSVRYENSAGDHVEREQQDDEAHVLAHDRMRSVASAVGRS